MMKKITLFTLFALMTTVAFSQLEIQNFENAASDDFPILQNLAVEVIANPAKDDTNDSDNCLKIASTDGQHKWWSLVRIPIDPSVTISATETKFLSIMVNYPAQPDLIVRFDASEESPNGTNAGLIRAINQYDSSVGKVGTWQEIVFEIKDGPDDFAFTLGTLDRIVFHPDAQSRNEPAGRVLSDVTFGYMDNIRILDENPLPQLSVRDANLESAISIYPSSVTSTFKVQSSVAIQNVAIFNILGKSVTRNMVNVGNSTFDISALSSGMYIVKVTGENGNFMTKKLVKQ